MKSETLSSSKDKALPVQELYYLFFAGPEFFFSWSVDLWCVCGAESGNGFFTCRISGTVGYSSRYFILVMDKSLHGVSLRVYGGGRTLSSLKSIYGLEIRAWENSRTVMKDNQFSDATVKRRYYERGLEELLVGRIVKWLVD